MLSFHYAADYPAVVSRIAAGLKPGGRFALSVEHPVFSANPTGQWTRAGWPIDLYRDEGPRRWPWFVDGVVRYHRNVETYVNTLLAAGPRPAARRGHRAPPAAVPVALHES